MDQLLTTCCGIDIHKRTAVACLLRRAADGTCAAETRTFAAPLREWKPTSIGGQIASALRKPKPLKSAKIGRPGTPRNGVAEAFLAIDLRYANLLDEAASLDWNAVRLRPPVLPWLPLKLNLGDVFEIHRVHLTRHLGQIERTIAAL